MEKNFPHRNWIIRGGVLELGGLPKLMGIVNVTPDSFSDGGRFSSTQAAVDHALALVDQGADILDLGGESTRPGAAKVPLDEELRRVVPVVEKLIERVSIPISIDTTKAGVARAALQAGAAIINDISGLRFDPEMVEVCREYSAGVVCMHMQGTPETMQQAPAYENVVHEIVAFFEERRGELCRQGLTEEQLVWDPGVGFGKLAGHNLEILSRVSQFRVGDRPVLIGHSRKRFLQKVLQREERVYGTIGITLGVALQGAEIIRVHDVAANRDALLAFSSIVGVPATGG